MMVRIKVNATSPATKYHTERCRNYPEDGRDISLTSAKNRDMDECRFCSGDQSQPTTDPHKYLRRIKEARGDD